MKILIIIWRIITTRISPVSEKTVSTAAAPTASASPYNKVVRGRPRPLAPEALPSAHNRSTSPSSRTVRPSKRIFLSLMLFINTRLFRQLLHRLICLCFVHTPHFFCKTTFLLSKCFGTCLLLVHGSHPYKRVDQT